ncbi:caspase family protein [Candidatus Pacearchaeota archaeon]|nr:caspase family protein [Candidatus Pacearchaeota archaeon]
MRKYDEAKVRNFLLKENFIWNNPVVAWAMLAPVSMPGFLYNAYQIGKNRYQTSGKDKARVLVFDEPLTEWQNLMLGVKGAIARFFTERDIRVDYKHNARSEELKGLLANEDYQNIVVMGHGGKNQWCARDGTVHTEDVDEWMSGLPKKKGYFIQFTCGGEEGRPLGHSVVEDKSKILGYTKPVHLGDRFDSLWGESLKGIEGLVNINKEALANQK